MPPVTPSSTLSATSATAPSSRSAPAREPSPRSSPTAATSLIALELDRELAPALAFRFRNQPNVQIIEADVLKTDLRDARTDGETADVIGNLPYYITSDILLQLFAAGSSGILTRAVVMMQREVADRVSAAPGVRDYGLLSATAQMNAEVEHLFTLPPSAFSPPPEVYSTVLRLELRPALRRIRGGPRRLRRIPQAIFAQKRKTLQNNLRAAGYTPQQLAAAWPASIPAQARAESLALEPIAEFYRALSADKSPGDSRELNPYLDLGAAAGALGAGVEAQA